MKALGIIPAIWKTCHLENIKPTRMAIYGKRKKYYRARKEAEQKKIMWLVACAVFGLCFIAYFIYGFSANCIFHWPIRWDIGACWHEQIQPAENKAAQSASNFVPQ
jgi:hypothetical protein